MEPQAVGAGHPHHAAPRDAVERRLGGQPAGMLDHRRGRQAGGEIDAARRFQQALESVVHRQAARFVPGAQRLELGGRFDRRVTQLGERRQSEACRDARRGRALADLGDRTVLARLGQGRGRENQGAG